MAFKSYEERLKVKYDLDALCRVAGYISGDEATQEPFTLKDRMRRLANGMLVDKERIEKFMQTDRSIFENVFLRELGNEGVEIFYFQDRNVWHQKEQNLREGLVYFCLPNKARLEHEEEYTHSVTHLEEFKAKKGEYFEAYLNLDRMYPDKWGHFALEILLKQAKQD